MLRANSCGAFVSGTEHASGKVLCMDRSEEHTSELQSQFHLVCRLLLEKKKKYIINHLPFKLNRAPFISIQTKDYCRSFWLLPNSMCYNIVTIDNSVFTFYLANLLCLDI